MSKWNSLAVFCALLAGIAVCAVGIDAEDDLKLGGAKKETARQPRLTQPVRRAEIPAKGVRYTKIELNIPEGTSVHTAWQKYFAELNKSNGVTSENARLMLNGNIRETARQFMKNKQFDDVVAMIHAALSNGFPQPWMYEAVALAMQANHAPREDVERALMSAVDFSNDPNDLMIVAAYMADQGFSERALKIYESVSQLNPGWVEPYVQGLAQAERVDDQDAIEWACIGLLKQSWPNDEVKIAHKALRTALARKIELKEAGETEKHDDFEARLNKALIRDCIVKVTWTGDADIDVLVEEPSGTVCSLKNQRTTGGGVLLGDSFAQEGKANVDGWSETYSCPEGFSGTYRVLLRRIWGKVTNGKVTVELVKHYGTPGWTSEEKLVSLSDKDAMVVFDLENGRREESLSEHQVATVASNQSKIRRHVLYQMLNTVEDSLAVRDFSRDTQQAVQDGRLPARFRRRGVGFRPQITTLPEGANMTASAIISADRRYVRISPQPLFSQVGEVNTFTFAGGAAGGAGGGALGGGGGGGALGGGGVIGGGGGGGGGLLGGGGIL